MFIYVFPKEEEKKNIHSFPCRIDCGFAVVSNFNSFIHLTEHKKRGVKKLNTICRYLCPPLKRNQREKQMIRSKKKLAIPLFMPSQTISAVHISQFF